MYEALLSKHDWRVKYQQIKQIKSTKINSWINLTWIYISECSMPIIIQSIDFLSFHDHRHKDCTHNWFLHWLFTAYWYRNYVTKTSIVLCNPNVEIKNWTTMIVHMKEQTLSRRTKKQHRCRIFCPHLISNSLPLRSLPWEARVDGVLKMSSSQQRLNFYSRP